MPISVAETAALTCPICTTAFDAAIWLIVAAAERPDLVERIRAGTLHTTACPACGHVSILDVPLLIYRSAADPPILLSPAQQTSRTQDQHHAVELIAELRERLGSAWNDAWVDQGMPDESLGLPGGFLQAGVPAVVGTLWAVNDLSTALLMHRFYTLYLHGDAAQGLAAQPAVRALRQAQRWLRDLTYNALDHYVDGRRARPGACDQAVGRPALSMIQAGRELAEEAADPQARPYADPVFWAAFTFAGAIEEQVHER